MNNKTKENKSKSQEITMIIIVLLLNLFTIFVSKMNDLDELWIYSFSKNMAQSLLPYRDFNMITTPLLPFIISLIFKLLGAKLIIQRLASFVLYNFTLLIAYKIVKNSASKKIGMLFIISLMNVYLPYIHIDYNFLLLLILLIMLYIEIKTCKETLLYNNTKIDIIIGVLAGLIILTKQTIGIIALIAVSLYKVIEVKSINNFKKFVIQLGIRFVSGLVTVFPFIAYLFLTNTANDFYDQCILGIRTFNNSFNSLFWFLGLVTYLIIIIVSIVNKIKKEQINEQKSYIYLVYSIISFFICIPIADRVHIILALTIPAIAIFNLIFSNKKVNNVNEKNINICIVLMTIILLLSLVSNCIYTIYTSTLEKRDNQYKYMFVDNEVKECTAKVDQFILEKKANGIDVYIIDATSAQFNIPLNIYRKYYDLLLVGNIGLSGEKSIIEDLNNKDNVIYLINKNPTSVQNIESIIEYVKTNFNKVGEIECFEVYQ